MADYILGIMEEMIPSLKHFQKHEIFSKGEIQNIIRKREETQYTLHSGKKNLVFYQRAIKYEKKLEEKRIKRSPKHLKRTEHDGHIFNRIHYLYKLAMRKLKSLKDLKEIVDGYAQWLTHTNQTHFLAKMWGRLLQSYPMEEHFWKKAAESEVNGGDIEAGRALFQQSLRMLPDSEVLFIAYFTLEVKYSEKLLQSFLNNQNKGTETEEEKELELDNLKPLSLPSGLAAVFEHSIPKIVFESAASNPTLGKRESFYGNALAALRSFKFSADLQDFIHTIALKELPGNAVVIARFIARKLTYSENFNYSCSKLIAGETEAHQQKQMEDFASIQNSAFDLFWKFVDILPTAQMWSQFYDFCVEQLQKNNDEIQQEKIEHLLHGIISAALTAVDAPANKHASHSSSSPSLLEVEVLKQVETTNISLLAPPLKKRKLGPAVSISEQMKLPVAASVIVCSVSGLEPSMYLAIIEQHNDANLFSEVIRVSQQALKFHKTNVDLWLCYLKALIKNNDDTSDDDYALSREMETNFRAALRALTGNTRQWELWVFFIEFKTSVLAGELSPEEMFVQLQKLFREAIVSITQTTVDSDREFLKRECTFFDKSEALSLLCGQYLECAMLLGGSNPELLTAASNFCFQTSGVPLSIFQLAIKIERNKIRTDAPRVRGLYEKAVSRFGHECGGLWMDWVMFEHQQQEFPRVQLLHARATRALQSPDLFCAEFSEWREDASRTCLSSSS